MFIDALKWAVFTLTNSPANPVILMDNEQVTDQNSVYKKMSHLVCRKSNKLLKKH